MTSLLTRIGRYERTQSLVAEGVVVLIANVPHQGSRPCRHREIHRHHRHTWRPSIAELRDEYVSGGGRMFVCPVCVEVRNKHDVEWIASSTGAGVPAVFDYTTGGALVFNY